MQKVDFEYEILIIDDCSTDSTRDIITNFQKSEPEKIRLILEEKNKNDNSTWAKAITTVRSEYIALLDADDYWTSPHKLQKQVDHLDTYPECTICFHNVIAFYEDKSREAYYFNPPNQKEISTLDDLWGGCFIACCSVMLRGRLFTQLPEWIYSMQCADWSLYILYAHRGKIGYINEVMGAYRIHNKGLWSRLSKIEQLTEIVEFYKYMNFNLEFVYNKTIKRLLSKCYFELTLENQKIGDSKTARSYFIKGIVASPVNPKISNRIKLRVLLSLYVPTLYRFIKLLIKSIYITTDRMHR
jgi:glycosyltransferase involved in cell wall biosynthesis